MTAYSSSVTSTTYERWFIASNEKYQDLSGTNEIIQQYVIRRLDGGVLNYNGDDLNLMIVEEIIPAVGDPYSMWDPLTVKGIWQALARCRSVDFETADKTGNRAVVTIVWSTYAAVDPKTIYYLGTNPVDPAKNVTYLPARLEYQATLRAAKVFNTKTPTAALTAPPTAGTTSPWDPIDISPAHIGGSTVSDYNNGLMTEVSQVRVKLVIMRDASVAKMSDQWNVVKDYIGKIHAKTADNFFNFAPGTIICEGVSMNKLDHEYYEVVFDFLWDEFYHHNQVPKLTADGQPILSGNTLQYQEVKWQRQARDGVNFNNIFSSEPGLKAIVERGYWAP